MCVAQIYTHSTMDRSVHTTSFVCVHTHIYGIYGDVQSIESLRSIFFSFAFYAEDAVSL